MRMFDVQGIEIAAPRRKVFEFLREPASLPRWAHAFVSAGDGRARLETSAGAVDVGLRVTADAETGVVDWRLAFPDGSVGIARETRELVRRAEQARWALQVHRATHPRSSAVDFARRIAQSLDARQDP